MYFINGEQVTFAEWRAEQKKQRRNAVVCGVLYTIAGALASFAVASIVAMLVNCF